MRVEDFLTRLTEVEPSNYTNASRLRLVEHLTKRVPPYRAVWAAIVKRYFRGIVRNDSAHSKEQNICIEVGEPCREGRRIKGRVGFTQIRL
jgi:hypothetical protein